MYHIKDDQRAQRSAETIYSALTALITKQPFDTIKVSALVEQAQIGRSTFYRNFDVIEDVLRWRCERVVNDLMVYLEEYWHSQQVDRVFPLLKPVLRFFYLHSTIIELLLAAKRIDILQIAFQTHFEQSQWQHATIIDTPSPYLIYGPIIRSSVAVNILVHWVENGKQEPPDALADGIAKLTSQMIGLGILL